jgi:hypothetical protein
VVGWAGSSAWFGSAVFDVNPVEFAIHQGEVIGKKSGDSTIVFEFRL